MWKLRILNTEHAGAEITLSDSLVMGSDEMNADIVIDQEVFPGILATITTSEDGVRLGDIADTIRVESNGVTLAINDLMPLQVPIKLGDLFIAFKSINERWNKEIIDFNENQPSNKDNNPIADEISISTISTLKNSDKDVKLGILSIFCIITILLASYYLLYPKYNPNYISSNTDDNLLEGKVDKSLSEGKTVPDSIESILDKPQYASITANRITEDEDSLWIVSGYVDDDVTLARLNRYINNLNMSVSVNVYSNQKIINSANLVITNMGLDIHEIITVEPGSYIAMIDGNYLPSWERAKEALKRDVPGINEWKLKVKSKISPYERLKSIIDSKGISSWAKATYNNEKLQIIAPSNSSRQEIINEVINEFKLHVGNYPAIEHVIPKNGNRVRSLNDIGITAVRSGSAPYVTYENGKRYLLGSELPNGGRVESLGNGEVTIALGNKSYVIRYDKNSTGDLRLAYKQSDRY